MAKLNRERKVIEKRHKKAARKELRKQEGEAAAAAGEDRWAGTDPDAMSPEDIERVANSA
jgi:hypothetical protein